MSQDQNEHDDDRDESEAPPERRAPVVPDNGYTRESYAIHATRSDLPLFSSALTGDRDDADWLSSLSGMLGGGEPDAAATAAESAIERRRRASSDDA
ncbi:MULTISPECIES: hypothetical protein [unclassified Rathayibacter]|uniref:hypothetical protein n=1 Tax=unclassified Rathayibacter TaxID=2609250 RepID=UPI0006F34D97|nr:MULTISPECIES: hypothetical protein [unclassified Rathayibacter]KQQ05408.1 hypothetical protein ASF42_02130 [Rathayibacter sp. Leaf294]KQS13272.1 hypothetical protein ASG06_02140 [Rathayibacter sp. Leaf185]